MTRYLIFAFMVMTCAAQTKGPSAGSVEAVAAAMWQKILATCSVQGEQMTFLQDSSAIFEFSGAWTKVTPFAVTEADARNGIKHQASTLLSGTSRRVAMGGGKWKAWAPGIEKSAANSTSTFSPTLRASHLPDLGNLLAVGVRMEEKNGSWHFAFAKSGSGLHEFDPDELATKKKSCAELTSEHPFGNH